LGAPSSAAHFEVFHQLTRHFEFLPPPSLAPTRHFELLHQLTSAEFCRALRVSFTVKTRGAAPVCAHLKSLHQLTRVRVCTELEFLRTLRFLSSSKLAGPRYCSARFRSLHQLTSRRSLHELRVLCAPTSEFFIRQTRWAAPFLRALRSPSSLYVASSLHELECLRTLRVSFILQTRWPAPISARTSQKGFSFKKKFKKKKNNPSRSTFCNEFPVLRTLRVLQSVKLRWAAPSSRAHFEVRHQKLTRPLQFHPVNFSAPAPSSAPATSNVLSSTYVPRRVCTNFRVSAHNFEFLHPSNSLGRADFCAHFEVLHNIPSRRLLPRIPSSAHIRVPSPSNSLWGGADFCAQLRSPSSNIRRRRTFCTKLPSFCAHFELPFHPSNSLGRAAFLRALRSLHQTSGRVRLLPRTSSSAHTFRVPSSVQTGMGRTEFLRAISKSSSTYAPLRVPP